MVDQFPAWRYGPDGQSGIFESEADVPKGWEDHPTKVKGAEPAGGGVQTATQSANGSISEAGAAKTTEAKSQTATDPAKAAKSGVGGEGTSKPADAAKGTTEKEELDTDGHPYDPTLHASTKSKTKDGKWRMKVGIARPAPAKGYPLDL